MQKRRERIEKWRDERKKKAEAMPITIVPPSKKWSLEDDDDDDEELGPPVKKEKGEEEGESADVDAVKMAVEDDDDVDPLDAYMAVSI